jgi:nitroreductase
MKEAVQEGQANPDVPFPSAYPKPYDALRRDCGVALYKAMKIPREDKAAREAAWLRNYDFFDAPHLLVVSRDKHLGEYATLDIGVWLGAFLMAAHELDVDTCPMASVAAYPGPLRRLLDIPEDQLILFGVALGKADPQVPANQAQTTREPVPHNLRVLGEV